MMQLTLDTISTSHVEKIRQWRNEQIDVLRQHKPISEVEQQEYFQGVHKDQRQVLFSILNGNKLVGYCGLVNINHVYKNCEVSFLCDTSLINREDYDRILLFAFEEMFKYGFESLNMNRIWTETYSFRTEHLKLLSLCGLGREGVLRETVYCSGQYHDSVVQSILRREYELQKQARSGNRG